MVNSADLFDLKGRVAIVAGAGAGFGETIAEAYAWYRAIVTVVDIDAEGAKPVAQKVTDNTSWAISLSCDVGLLSEQHCPRENGNA